MANLQCSLDGTLLVTCASQKSFRSERKRSDQDELKEDGWSREVSFHEQLRPGETKESVRIRRRCCRRRAGLRRRSGPVWRSVQNELVGIDCECPGE